LHTDTIILAITATAAQSSCAQRTYQ